jgi:AhpD family alkylhydroperoxidase
MASQTEHEQNYHRIISRLPALPDPLHPISQTLFAETKARGGHVLNLHLATAHAPRLVETKRPFSMALRNECQTSRALRELTILRTGQILDCPYELDHHIPLALKAGISQAQIDALSSWREQASLFNAQEQALLAFLDEFFARIGEVSDATFAPMQAQFSPQEIVELIFTATTYQTNAYILKSLRIIRDESHVRATPGKF